MMTTSTHRASGSASYRTPPVPKMQLEGGTLGPVCTGTMGETQAGLEKSARPRRSRSQAAAGRPVQLGAGAGVAAEMAAVGWPETAGAARQVAAAKNQAGKEAAALQQSRPSTGRSSVSEERSAGVHDQPVQQEYNNPGRQGPA